MNALTVAPGTPEHDLRRWRRRRIVGTAVVLAVVLAATAAVWVWRHPDRSFAQSYGVEMTHGVDGAAVVVEYAVCDLDPVTLAAEGVSGSGYGGPDGELDRYCTRLVPAEGASMTLGTDPGRELLGGVTPTRRGRTVIASHRIEFREGWQQGSDDIHVEVVLTGH